MRLHAGVFCRTGEAASETDVVTMEKRLVYFVRLEKKRLRTLCHTGKAT